MFKRKNGFGGKPSGKKDFGERVIHKTTCNKCGDSCEVPFKPNGKKPVFCNNCFVKDDSGFDRVENREKRYSDKPSYSAICSDCGKKCDVPFKPTQGKPVMCRACFSGNDSFTAIRHPEARNNLSSDQFQILNKKLDTILKVLGTSPSVQKKNVEVDIDEEPKPLKKAWAKIKYD